mgnify:CR=1 FL=1
MLQPLFLRIVSSFLDDSDIFFTRTVNRFPAHRHRRIQHEVLEPLQKRAFSTRAKKVPESSGTDGRSHAEQGACSPAFPDLSLDVIIPGLLRVQVGRRVIPDVFLVIRIVVYKVWVPLQLDKFFTAGRIERSLSYPGHLCQERRAFTQFGECRSFAGQV